MVRDNMHASERKRVGAARPARRGTKRRHGHRTRGHRRNIERLLEHQRLYDAPMEVDVVCDAAGEQSLEMHLAEDDRPVGRDAPPIAHSAQHEGGRVRRGPIDQQVRVEPGAQMRRGVEGVGEVGPFRDEELDSGSRQLGEQRREPAIEQRRMHRLKPRLLEQPDAARAGNASAPQAASSRAATR